MDYDDELKALYQRGVTDGMELVVRCVLGLADAGFPANPGVLDAASRQWAEQALAAIRASSTTLDAAFEEQYAGRRRRTSSLIDC